MLAIAEVNEITAVVISAASSGVALALAIADASDRNTVSVASGVLLVLLTPLLTDRVTASAEPAGVVLALLIAEVMLTRAANTTSVGVVLALLIALAILRSTPNTASVDVLD